MAVANPAPLPPLESPRSAWRLLFRAVGVASDPRSLILAAIGVAALYSGWGALAAAFDHSEWIGSSADRRIPALNSFGPVSNTFPTLLTAILAPAVNLLRPFVASFRPDLRSADRLYQALGAIWSVLVWSVFGGAIARIAVVRVARGARVGVVSALGYSLKRLGTLLAAPLVPIAVACLIALAGVVVGLLVRVSPALATILAFIPLVVGLLDAVILLGLAAAWPLMVATVAADGEDFFDAISRSYSYVNQQTFRYAGYLALAAILGTIGLVLVSVFAATALGLADWSMSLGAPRNVGFRFSLPDGVDRSDLPAVARFWNGLVEAILAGWTISYLWTTAAIVYLVLRRDVDGAEIHDIYEPSQDADPLVPEKTGDAVETS
jgi:hypothetical protein